MTKSHKELCLKPNGSTRSFRLLAIGVSLGLMAGTVAFATQPAKSSKFDAFVQAQVDRRENHGWSSVIIKFREKPTDVQLKKLKALKVDVTKSLDMIDSAAAMVPKRNLKRLAALSFVQHISSDVTATKNDEFTVDHSFANRAYSEYGLTGSNVTVAVVDSGISPSADLVDPATGRSRVLASVSFVPAQGVQNPNNNVDPCGHGTHVAGIVAGNGAASTGSDYFRTFFGVARGANLVNVRVLDANGTTKVSQLVSALTWVRNNASRYNIKVVNLSMGHPAGDYYKNDPLCLAVEQVWKSGIVVVVAAGNNGRKNPTPSGDPMDNEGYGTAYGTINSPANDPYVITVGAMKMTDGERASDKVATYSSRGPSRLDMILKPDIMAPGNQVISLRRPGSTLELQSPANLMPLSSYMYSPPENGALSYFKLSGTSMATPVVAGAAALMLQQNPTLSPDTVKLRLMMTADKWVNGQNVGDVCTFGSGYMNVAAALNSQAMATGYAMSPYLTKMDDGRIIMTITDGSEPIGGSGGGGHSGGPIALKPFAGNIDDLRAIWGDRALWGDGTLAENRALWGDGVWGDRAIWGTDIFSLGTGPVVLNGE